MTAVVPETQQRGMLVASALAIATQSALLGTAATRPDPSELMQLAEGLNAARDGLPPGHAAHGELVRVAIALGDMSRGTHPRRKRDEALHWLDKVVRSLDVQL